MELQFICKAIKREVTSDEQRCFINKFEIVEAENNSLSLEIKTDTRVFEVDRAYVLTIKEA
jgi:hypothetical protein